MWLWLAGNLGLQPPTAFRCLKLTRTLNISFKFVHFWNYFHSLASKEVNIFLIYKSLCYLYKNVSLKLNISTFNTTWLANIIHLGKFSLFHSTQKLFLQQTWLCHYVHSRCNIPVTDVLVQCAGLIAEWPSLLFQLLNILFTLQPGRDKVNNPSCKAESH